MSGCFLISILTYRMESGVKNCLESVLRAGGNFDLHLTANGCPEAAEFFGSFFRNDLNRAPVVVVNKENLGFIDPNNRAMRYAQDRGYDYLVLLNDDSTVPRGWLGAMESEFQRNPAAAIVGASGNCRTLNQDFHGYHGSTLDYVEGSCAAYKVSVWKKHFKTLFPDWLFFCYGEDASASLEVRRLGYTIHEAKFHIEHNRGATSKHVPQAKKAQTRNHEVAKVRYKHFLSTKTFNHRIVVRRMAAAGDVLLTTPVIRKLWQENPLCEIVVETLFPEIFSGNPCVSFAAKQIARQPADLVFDLDMVSENAPLRHFVTSYARHCGVEVSLPCKLEIYWAEDKFNALMDVYRWIAVHAGSSTWRAKEYKAEHWNAVLAGLRADGWKIVLVGSGELPGLTGWDWDARKETKTLNDLACLISHTECFVGLDSAPLHVAQAVSVPAIGLFGVTDPRYILTHESAHGVCADPILYPRAGERHRIAGINEVAEDGTIINSIKPSDILDTIKHVALTEITA